MEEFWILNISLILHNNVHLFIILAITRFKLDDESQNFHVVADF